MFPASSRRHPAGFGGGIIRHGAKLLFAFAEAPSQKLPSLPQGLRRRLLRHGQQTYPHRRQFRLATAEIAVMGPEGAVDIVYKRELAKVPESERENCARKKNH